MGDENPDEDIFEEFLESRGHTSSQPNWIRDKNKKKCPDCFSLHELDATVCKTCGWETPTEKPTIPETNDTSNSTQDKQQTQSPLDSLL